MKTISLEQVKQAGLLLKREHEERLRLEKVAQDNELEKKAMRIAFREVELGITEPYKTHEEFLQKVANLKEEDLDVVEKALERGYGSARRFGELAEGPVNKGSNVLERWVLNGEEA
jgi:methylphosphotriester-DNA--protein-cysteine methyltransferase